MISIGRRLHHPPVDATEVIYSLRHEVKAVIVLKGRGGTEDLKSEIQQLVRQRLSTHAYPRKINFFAGLPKTPSGKIQHFILRGGA